MLSIYLIIYCGVFHHLISNVLGFFFILLLNDWHARINGCAVGSIPGGV